VRCKRVAQEANGEKHIPQAFSKQLISAGRRPRPSVATVSEVKRPMSSSIVTSRFPADLEAVCPFLVDWSSLRTNRAQRTSLVVLRQTGVVLRWERNPYWLERRKENLNK
jgi:hypothetical protein